MEVGQFNLGFIVARLRGHLFILDQHASDERRNFERLQACTQLTKQRLVHPLPLQLSAADAFGAQASLEGHGLIWGRIRSGTARPQFCMRLTHQRSQLGFEAGLGAQGRCCCCRAAACSDMPACMQQHACTGIHNTPPPLSLA